MNKPNKFDDFIYVILKEARRYSLIDLCDSFNIDENEMNECLTWLEHLKEVKLMEAVECDNGSGSFWMVRCE